MPVPVEVTPTWVTNLLYVFGGLGTAAGAALAAFVVKRKEAKAGPPEGTSIVAVAGALQDSRSLNRLTEQLAENGRSMRDGERTNRDVERAVTELNRTMSGASDQLGDVLRFMEARDKREKSEEARMLKIIEASRGKV